MQTPYTLSLDKIITNFSLEVINMPIPPEQILITTAEVNRPGLALAGFFEHFENKRIQLIGRAEMSFLENTSPEFRRASIYDLFEKKPVVVVVTRGLEIYEDMVLAAKEYDVPILRTKHSTSSFTSSLISALSVELAPRMTQHGVLLEIYGEGILIIGESGVGKSETAIELVKRGHRLIADDAVDIRRVSDRTLVGSSAENIRHFLELRGVGIVNVKQLFGVSAVKITEKIDLVIQMELWDQKKMYDRMGLDNEEIEILGIEVPAITIPVKPGRNLSIIIEVAAMNHRQKKLGYNAAKDLLARIENGVFEDESDHTDWYHF